MTAFMNGSFSGFLYSRILDVYTSTWSQKLLSQQSRLGYLRHCLFHTLPPAGPKPFPQPVLRRGPAGFGRRQLPLASPSETKEAGAPVSSASHAHPAQIGRAPCRERDENSAHAGPVNKTRL